MFWKVLNRASETILLDSRHSESQLFEIAVKNLVQKDRSWKLRDRYTHIFPLK